MEEEEVESESTENEAISIFKIPDKEEEPKAQDQIVARMNVDLDVRLEEHTYFVSGDEFIRSKEFKSFLYHFKGNRLREAMPNVTPKNEVEMLRKMKAEINLELEGMAP